MLYENLETKFKRKISGSINSTIVSEVNYSFKGTFLDVYICWLKYCTENEDGIKYYLNRGIILKQYELEEELLNDIKNIFKERVEKRVEKLEYRLKTEPKNATDKQIKFANKLYFKLYKVHNFFQKGDYSKSKLSQVIEELLETIESKNSNSTKDKSSEFKIISLNDWR